MIKIKQLTVDQIIKDEKLDKWLVNKLCFVGVWIVIATLFTLVTFSFKEFVLWQKFLMCCSLCFTPCGFTIAALIDANKLYKRITNIKKFKFNISKAKVDSKTRADTSNTSQFCRLAFGHTNPYQSRFITLDENNEIDIGDEFWTIKFDGQPYCAIYSTKEYNIDRIFQK